MEGAQIPQSLWKPFRVWLWLFNFLGFELTEKGWFGVGVGAWVSHLMVPELEQRSAMVVFECRREAPAEKNGLQFEWYPLCRREAPAPFSSPKWGSGASWTTVF